MSTTIVKKNRFHRPSHPVSPIVYQNQIETQPNTRPSHASKLVFNDSEDDETQLPLRNTTNGQLPNYSSYVVRSNSQNLGRSRRRPFSRQIVGGTCAMKPSIMQNIFGKDDSYDDIVNCEQVNRSSRLYRSNHKIKAKPTIAPPKMDNFIDELITKKVIKQQMRAELRRSHRLQFNIDDDEAIAEEEKNIKESNKSSGKIIIKEETIVMPKIPISSLYFEDSGDEEPAPIKQQVTKPSKKAEEEQVQQRQEIEKKAQHSECLHESLTPTAEQYPEVDITSCEEDPKVAQRSIYLEQHLRKKLTPQERNNVMNAPILPGTKLIFEVHVYATLTQKQYFFWLETGNEMMLLMKAKKYTHFNRTEFELTTYIQSTKEDLECCRLVSNFDRSRYNILKQERSTNRLKLLGTICSSICLNNSKTIVLYYPKLNQKYMPTIFYQHSTDLDLQSVYRENKIQEVQFIVTGKMNVAKLLQLMSQQQLRASQKSMEFKESSGTFKVIIGKRCSKRYRVIAGPGITPIQLFSLVVVQIQT